MLRFPSVDLIVQLRLRTKTAKDYAEQAQSLLSLALKLPTSDRKAITDQAIAAWEEAARHEPNSGPYAQQYVTALYNDQRYDDAIHAAQRSIASLPRSETGTLQDLIAHAAYQTSQWQTADAAWREAERLRYNFYSSRCTPKHDAD